MSTDDPFETLVRYLRDVAASLEPTRSDDEVIELATANEPHPVTAPRPRRWVAPVAALVVLALGSGAAAVFVALGDDARPEGGTVCRTAPSLSSSARVLAVSTDPVGDCAALWIAGELPSIGGQNGRGSSPALIACIGAGRAVEVLPATNGESCASLGLGVVDVAAVRNDPVVVLEERLVNEINTTCVPVEAAPDVVRAILDELALDEWTVRLQPRDGECGRAGLDSATRTVFVVPGPPDPGG